MPSRFSSRLSGFSTDFAIKDGRRCTLQETYQSILPDYNPRGLDPVASLHLLTHTGRSPSRTSREAVRESSPRPCVYLVLNPAPSTFSPEGSPQCSHPNSSTQPGTINLAGTTCSSESGIIIWNRAANCVQLNMHSPRAQSTDRRLSNQSRKDGLDNRHNHGPLLPGANFGNNQKRALDGSPLGVP
jgi:hypothetical protein